MKSEITGRRGPSGWGLGCSVVQKWGDLSRVTSCLPPPAMTCHPCSCALQVTRTECRGGKRNWNCLPVWQRQDPRATDSCLLSDTVKTEAVGAPLCWCWSPLQ